MTGSAHPQPGEGTGRPDLRAVGERIDALLDASGSAGAVARERAEELVRLVADLYGAGIERILDIVYEAGHLGEDVRAALSDDELVASLLVVHGLHPYGVVQRVEQALEKVRPYLGSHGGDVELLEVTTDGAVRLRLLGSCEGCPSSAVTLKLAVEGAIEAVAPEVTRIEVETAADAGPGLIPAESLLSRLRDTDQPGTWQPVPELVSLVSGAVAAVTIEQTPTVACRLGGDLFAFRSTCPRCGNALADASLGRRLGAGGRDAVLVCPGCRAHFDVRRAGACLDDPALHLDPLPLLRDGEVVSVAVPRPVPS